MRAIITAVCVLILCGVSYGLDVRTGHDKSVAAITSGTIDGAVIGGTTPAIGRFTTLTGLLEGAAPAGAHTVTSNQANGGYLLVTAAGDVDLPDDCDSATFASIRIVVRDASETVSVTLANSQEDTIIYPGLSLTPGDEIDSPGNALDEITLVCAEANKWYANGTAGWTDGGGDD